jgi:hypothetical protein
MSEGIDELKRAGYIACDLAWQAQKGLHDAAQEFQEKFPTEIAPAYTHVLAWAKTKQGAMVESGVLATMEFADGTHTGTGTESLSTLFLFLRTLPSDVRQDLTLRLLNFATEPLVKSAEGPRTEEQLRADARAIGETLHPLPHFVKVEVINGMTYGPLGRPQKQNEGNASAEPNDAA